VYSNLQNQKIYTAVSAAAPHVFTLFHSGLFNSDGSHNAKWLCQALTNPELHVNMVPRKSILAPKIADCTLICVRKNQLDAQFICSIFRQTSTRFGRNHSPSSGGKL
jgi:hypothetical protein